MSEKVQRGIIKMIPVSLVIGWMFFVIGLLIVKPIWLKVVLLSAARVLP